VDGEQHRTDGPAVEWANGSKQWWVNDQRHRTDGPAIEYTDGMKRWYIHGEELSEEEFRQWKRSQRKNGFENIRSDWDHFTAVINFSGKY
jgi:hypothetical protein